jgi:long-subunit fatty acid transport protein
MNKKAKALILALSVLYALCSVLLPGISYAETTGAAFLKIGVGARPIGMGSTFVGIADDANAVFWNPGGLGQLTQQEINAMHTEWIANINYDYIGYIYPFGNNVLGVSVVYLSTGNIEETDVTGATIGNFNAYDACAVLSYARNIASLVNLGINVKFIQQKIQDDTAKGIAIDIGQLYQSPLKIVSVGLAVQNIGPKMKFVQESFSLPLTVTAGVGVKVISILTLGMDVRHQVIDKRTTLSFGTEYMPLPVLAFRAGYTAKLNKIGTDTGEVAGIDTNLAALNGLGVGIGFNLGITAIDYAFMPYGDLGNTHRFSLRVRF